MSFLRLTIAIVLIGFGAIACGSKAESGASSGVVIEPVASTTVSAAPEAVSGGKPAQPAPASPTNVQVAPPATPVAVATAAVAATAAPTPVVVSAPASDGSVAPTSGRWIDVDVRQYRVRLMDGTRALQVIAPVAVGAQVDTGAYESTQTGLFHVYSKIAGLQYDAPYRSYISDWVAFDAAKANGFHSFLEDEKGNVTDASTGRVSNGCIRVPDARAVFAFAEMGMPVYVHT